MTIDISVLIVGEAGQGIQTVGLMMARTCHKAGLYVMAVNDFESRIRGGHSFIQLRISDRPVHGSARKLHMMVALDERTYGLHQPELTEGGLALIPKDHADIMAQTVPLVIEQAEDEIDMVIGAAFAGVRAMTATSGGGFSLMTEGLGLAAITETPIVIVNAQRPGPARGLSTRTAQSDLQFVIHASQDEFPRFVFAPGTPFEAFSVTARVFELSERFQVPAIILMDQYLNDSLFVAEESFEAPETVATYTAAEDLEDPAGYRRYALTDSGISPRALPCKSPALVKACSDEHDEEGRITEDADIRDAMVAKRFAKVAAMRKEIRCQYTDAVLKYNGRPMSAGEITDAIKHRGFALVDILQSCVSFNRVNTHKWYKDRIAPIKENHDETDLFAALRLALGTDDRIPTGIYHRRKSPSYTDRIDKLNDKPLTDQRYRPEILKALLTDGYP